MVLDSTSKKKKKLKYTYDLLYWSL